MNRKNFALRVPFQRSNRCSTKNDKVHILSKVDLKAAGPTVNELYEEEMMERAMILKADGQAVFRK